MRDGMTYKCPCCGGGITFDSKTQNMKCPYCDTEFDVETLKAYDDELNSAKEADMTWEVQSDSQWESAEGMGVYSCQSCGGEVVGDEHTAATSCPFCGNPIVMTGNLSGILRPDWVIPFKLDKAAAKEALGKHLKGKKLLPKVFKSENHIDEVKGVYVPFWLFDAEADADIRYKATRIRHWQDSDYDYEETSHYLVTREGELAFDQVPVDGSSKMADDLMESIEPFDFNEAVDFQTAYLAGYVADKYDVDADESIERANDRVKNSTEDAFAETVVGFNTVLVEDSNIRLSNGKVSYALLPVWMLNTTWK
ncbi:MAG: hypothetical protein RR472_00925, partial [Anaerovoracaceae bacterium]